MKLVALLVMLLGLWFAATLIESHTLSISTPNGVNAGAFYGFSEASASVRMSIAEPVSWLARRTFWPRRPIASDS